MKAVRSSYHVLIVPSLSSSNHVFMRIGFGSTIKLVSFDESQVVTFNGKFICGFRNSDYGTRSQSNNMVGSPHGFIIHWIVILKNIKKVMEVIDVENWQIENSRVLRWIVSLIEWNSFVSSMKSSIQNGKCGVPKELMRYFDLVFNSLTLRRSTAHNWVGQIPFVEDKQSQLGVFSSGWLFGGKYTWHLESFGEETERLQTYIPNLLIMIFAYCGLETASQALSVADCDISGDGVRNLAMEFSDMTPDLKRSRIIYVATESGFRCDAVATIFYIY
ncbi:hypothetical protein Tco_1541292 [Tanacetum coccineum]